jgi:hypothetical protein
MNECPAEIIKKTKAQTCSSSRQLLEELFRGIEFERIHALTCSSIPAGGFDFF